MVAVPSPWCRVEVGGSPAFNAEVFKRKVRKRRSLNACSSGNRCDDAAPAMLPAKPPVCTACSVASTAPPMSTSVRSIIAGVHGVQRCASPPCPQFAGEKTVGGHIVGEQQKRRVVVAAQVMCIA